MQGSRQLITLTVVVLTLCGLTATVTTAVRAQQEGADPRSDLVLTDASIRVEVDDSRYVTANYTFRVDGDQPATINGTLWQFPDRQVTNLSVSVDGHSVDQRVQREGRHSKVSVPLETAATTESVSIRVSYRVDGPADRLRTPIWVPHPAPPGGTEAVAVGVQLPPGSHVRGQAFPTMDHRTDVGTGMQASLDHVPGVVALQYDREAALVTPGTLSASVAVGLLATILLGWVVVTKRNQRRGESRGT